MNYRTGEAPGSGSYRCKTCNQLIHLDDNSDRIPPCPNCNGSVWEDA